MSKFVNAYIVSYVLDDCREKRQWLFDEFNVNTSFLYYLDTAVIFRSDTRKTQNELKKRYFEILIERVTELIQNRPFEVVCDYDSLRIVYSKNNLVVFSLHDVEIV